MYAPKFLLAYSCSQCYIIHKEAAAHKVVSLDELWQAYPSTAKYKVGLFIFACYSYLYRQAAQSGMNRLKTTGLRSHMYPFAPPPLFLQVWEAYHLVTRLL